ncbi:hypothetical protein DFJ74DRAFT_663319 [Hyaloraphidium curvatum]|nr:hypothetical protein DFJ74DRAFT_663319 [Hyaloraphidium curvatum]
MLAARHASRAIKRTMSAPQLFLDAFCLRQFNDPTYTGTRIPYDPAAFEAKVNELHAAGAPLVDGYAPFCKHIFVRNFVPGLRCGYAPLTEENRGLVESGYEARTPKELPVLVQYIDRTRFEPPEATWLDVILYSREQIVEECEAMGMDPPSSDRPWGIISVKGQLEDKELSMTPITMMRNALGKAEGGSGVPLDREKYMEAVEFWRRNVPIK